MANRAYAAEDGNLNTKSVAVAVKKTYKDIDLSFTRRPGGDIFKKTDAASVKQGVKNVLLTASKLFMKSSSQHFHNPSFMFTKTH